MVSPPLFTLVYYYRINYLLCLLMEIYWLEDIKLPYSRPDFPSLLLHVSVTAIIEFRIWVRPSPLITRYS